MLCFVPVLRGYDWYVYCYVKRKLFSSAFSITERRDMGMYEVPLSMSLLDFGMGIMLANLHIYSIMLLLRAVLNTLVRNASPRGPMGLGA